MKRALWIVGLLILLGTIAFWGVHETQASNAAGEATITGSFTVPNAARDVTIELRRDSANGELVSTTVVPISSANSSIPVDFTINNVPPGIFSMVFSQPGHTRFIINGVNVSGNGSLNIAQNARFPQQIPLSPGDVGGVGQVNVTALSLMLSRWMSDDVNANITGSGQVNIADLSLLLSNWMAGDIVVEALQGDDGNDIILAEGVIDLYDAEPHVLVYTNEGATVMVSSNIFATPPQPGDIIMLPPDFHYPAGRAVRVLSATTSGANVVLQVTEPELEEVFSYINIDVTFTPDAQEIVDFNNARRAAIAGDNGIASRSTPFHEQLRLEVGTNNTISLIMTDFKYEATVANVTNSVTIDGVISLQIEEVNVYVDSWASWTDWLVVDVDITASMTVAANVKAELSTEFLIPLWPALMIPDSLLPRNTTVQAGIFAVIGLDGNIEVKLGMEYQISAGARGTMPHTPITPYFAVTDIAPVVEFTATLTGKAVVELRVDIEIASLNLIYFKANVGVGLSGTLGTGLGAETICPNIHIKLYLVSHLDVKLGKWEALSVVFLDSNNSPVIHSHFDMVYFVFVPEKCPCEDEGTPAPTPTPAPSYEELIGEWVGEWRGMWSRFYVQMAIERVDGQYQGTSIYTDPAGTVSAVRAHEITFDHLTGQFQSATATVNAVDGTFTQHFRINGRVNGDTLTGRSPNGNYTLTRVR